MVQTTLKITEANSTQNVVPVNYLQSLFVSVASTTLSGGDHTIAHKYCNGNPSSGES